MSVALGLSLLQNLVVVLFILICCAVILIVLLQKGRGGGIGAAFGGGGAGSLLGTKTGDFLTWVTICLVAAFLILAVLMGKFMRPAAPDLAPSLIPGNPAPEAAQTEPAATDETDAAPTPAENEQPAETDQATPVQEPETTETPAENGTDAPDQPTP